MRWVKGGGGGGGGGGGVEEVGRPSRMLEFKRVADGLCLLAWLTILTRSLSQFS